MASNDCSTGRVVGTAYTQLGESESSRPGTPGGGASPGLGRRSGQPAARPGMIDNSALNHN